MRARRDSELVLEHAVTAAHGQVDSRPEVSIDDFAEGRQGRCGARGRVAPQVAGRAGLLGRRADRDAGIRPDEVEREVDAPLAVGLPERHRERCRREEEAIACAVREVPYPVVGLAAVLHERERQPAVGDRCRLLSASVGRTRGHERRSTEADERHRGACYEKEPRMSHIRITELTPGWFT